MKDEIQFELDLLMHYKKQFVGEPLDNQSGDKKSIDSHFRYTVWTPLFNKVPIPIWDFDPGPVEADKVVVGSKEYLIAIYLCHKFYRSYLVDLKPLNSLAILEFFDKESPAYQKLSGKSFNFQYINDVDIVALRQCISQIVCDDDFYSDNSAFFDSLWNMPKKRTAPENRVADKQMGTKHTKEFLDAVNQGAALTGETKRDFVEGAVRERLKALGISYE